MELKNNRDWYSIVVYPQDEIISDVKILKDELEKRIGSYASKNSKAHTPLMAFYSEEMGWEFEKHYTKVFCYAEKPRHVLFDNIVMSENSGSVVILPNQNSKIYLNDLLKRFRHGLKHKKVHNGSHAHISIGRELSAEKIELAQDLFGNVSLNFVCEKIAIRKFNSQIGQFEVIYEFYFLNDPIEGQLSLFE